MSDAVSGEFIPANLDSTGERGNAPTPKIDLRNAEAMRREMAAVYRDARAKRIDVQDGTRLIYMLNALRQAYETDVLQKRIEKLEEFYGTQHQKAP